MKMPHSDTVADAVCPDGAAMALVVTAPKLKASIRLNAVNKDLIFIVNSTYEHTLYYEDLYYLL